MLKPNPRILISRMKFIGDVILTTPLIRAIRERYPGGYLGYLGEKEAVSLLENNPCLDEIIPFDFSRPSIIEQPSVIHRLRKRKFDVFIDLFSNPRSALLAFASGASVRIGKDSRGRGALYTHRIRDNGVPKTAIAFHYPYVRPIDVGATHQRTEIFLTPGEIADARSFLADKGISFDRPVAGMHPGATWPAKIWPIAKFMGVAGQLSAHTGAQVVFTQGPNDPELPASAGSAACGSAVILPPLPLRKLAAVLSLFRVYITNDCGPMHISVAVGTPTIGIFGPGEENIWFPYTPPAYDAGAGHRPLRHHVACHPCHLDFCNRSGPGYMACMTGLKEQTVLDAILPLIRQ